MFMRVDAVGLGMGRLGVSSVLAIALLALFLYGLGPQRLAAHLADANPVVFALGLLGIVLAVVCWSEATRRLFTASGVALSPRRGVITYGTGAFGKQVLPMGNAGGPAVMGFVYDRETDIGYSRAFAIVVIGELLSLVASILLATVGIFVLVHQGAPAGTIRWIGVGVAAVTVTLAAGSLVVWYRRAGVTTVLGSVATYLHPVVESIHPGIATRLEPQRIGSGLERYFETVEEMLAKRESILAAAFLSLLGWIFFVVPLYTSGLAVGVQIPMALVLFLVPAAGLATAFPLPGGLGGVEIALAALLVALTGLELAAAGAIVVLYRLCSFWFFILLGGFCAWLTTTRVPEYVGAIESLPPMVADQSLAIDEPE